MGVYLSKPKTEKNSEDGGEDDYIRYGLTSMQGWRRNMEDAHMATTKIDNEMDVSVYGVFDGHGGPAVAAWISHHFGEEFRENIKAVKKVLESGQVSLDTKVKCNLEETLLKPLKDPVKERSSLEGMGTFDAGGSDDFMTGGSGSPRVIDEPMDDINIIEEEPEEYILPRELPENTAIICEALQRTFLALDERMANESGRDQLKAIHDSLKSEDEELDMSQEINNLLQYYLDSGNGEGLVKLNDEYKCVQFVSSDDNDSDEYTWPDDDDEDNSGAPATDGSKRIEEITEEEDNEDRAGAGHVEGTAKDTVISDDVVAAGGDGKKGSEDVEMKKSTTAAKSTDEKPSTKLTTTSNAAETETSEGGHSQEMVVEDDKDDDDEPAVSFSRPRKAFKPKKRQELFGDGEDDDMAGGDDGDSDESGDRGAKKEQQKDEIPKLVPYEPENCGATAVVTAVMRGDPPMFIAANAGDSRVVLCRGGTAVALSKDHKPNNSRETRRIRAAGGRVLQGRVDGNLNLSRSVGDLAYKSDVTIPQETQKITSFPDVRVIPLHPDDEFAVIACDGIWDCLKNQEVVDIVRERIQAKTKAKQSKHAKPSKVVLSEICEAVCDKCLSQNPLQSEGVGCDNMTMMIIELGSKLRKSGKRIESNPKLYSGRLYRLLETENTPPLVKSGSRSTGSDSGKDIKSA